MAANDYTRTVNITPLGTAYSWDTPPSWITINRVGTSNDWTITVSANSGAARSATLTVRHNNTTTIDTISVSQAGGTVITPTPTSGSGSGAGPTPTPTSGSGSGAGPTPTPTATSVPVPPTPTPTSGSGSGAGPTPTPTSGSGAGPTPTPTPTSGSGAGPTPTPTSGSGAGPTPTPTYIAPTSTTYVAPTSTTYTGGGGGGGGCHLTGDLLTLANGETKKVEDVVLGDTLLSLAINGLSDAETIYREFNVSAANYSDEYTSAVVSDIYVDTYSSYYNINNGQLKLTLEHPVLVKTSDDTVVFKVIKDVLVGDSMLNQNNEWVLVNSNTLVQAESPFTTYAFNVENKDVYFASGILVHNVMDEQVLTKEEMLNQQ